ncbi:unnamed protein product [Soboliphyme baturini]|uniref:N-acetyltransferase GCN5 n=1 Tax=Soboliphyme baturini TaxID=241478 RepID=A0A183INS5_9BILA|nr:unnamed protein product [Soboliphyme baturini]
MLTVSASRPVADSFSVIDQATAFSARIRVIRSHVSDFRDAAHWRWTTTMATTIFERGIWATALIVDGNGCAGVCMTQRADTNSLRPLPVVLYVSLSGGSRGLTATGLQGAIAVVVGACAPIIAGQKMRQKTTRRNKTRQTRQDTMTVRRDPTGRILYVAWHGRKPALTPMTGPARLISC